jgi:hypothetical protein
MFVILLTKQLLDGPSRLALPQTDRYFRSVVEVERQAYNRGVKVIIPMYCKDLERVILCVCVCVCFHLP